MPICFDCKDGGCYTEYPEECGDYCSAFCCFDHGYSHEDSSGREHPPQVDKLINSDPKS